MPKVFVLAPSEKDVSKASMYGQIVFVFRPDERRPSVWDAEFALSALDRLEQEQYDPTNDYLLLVGNFIAIIAFVAAVAEQYYSPKALAFDMTRQTYVPIVLGVEYLTPNNESHNASAV